MGIFSAFAENKIINNVNKLMVLQNDTYSRFEHCYSKKDYCGAASDTRMMLEAISHIEHKFALHSQNNGFNVDYNTKFGQYAMSVHEFTKGLLGILSKAMIEEPKLRLEFVRQMVSETSQWKTRMVLAITRDNKELEMLESEIQNATTHPVR